MATECNPTPEITDTVYGELRRLAGLYLRGQRRDHTLQPTALVHEAYMRLNKWESAPWKDKTHFVGVAAGVMRQVLTQYARSRAAAKRGGGRLQISLSEPVAPEAAPLLVLALDRALNELESHSPQACRIVELRFFGGLDIEEIAGCLEISPATVQRSWTFAQTWLPCQLEKGSTP